MCLSASSFKFSLANLLSVRTVGLQEWECGGEDCDEEGWRTREESQEERMNGALQEKPHNAGPGLYRAKLPAGLS